MNTRRNLRNIVGIATLAVALAPAYQAQAQEAERFQLAAGLEFETEDHFSPVIEAKTRASLDLGRIALRYDSRNEVEHFQYNGRHSFAVDPGTFIQPVVVTKIRDNSIADAIARAGIRIDLEALGGKTQLELVANDNSIEQRIKWKYQGDLNLLLRQHSVFENGESPSYRTRLEADHGFAGNAGVYVRGELDNFEPARVAIGVKIGA